MTTATFTAILPPDFTIWSHGKVYSWNATLPNGEYAESNAPLMTREEAVSDAWRFFTAAGFRDMGDAPLSDSLAS